LRLSCFNTSIEHTVLHSKKVRNSTTMEASA
jgi:hypothetical protein